MKTAALSFDEILKRADSLVWGWPLIILILAVGLYLTVRCRFIQVFHLGKALKFMVQNEEGGKGEVSSFGALCTALSATIGTGSIVGVATAISAGGPGALFWMLVSAFFGMATKYAEGLLAVKYRIVDEDGHALGGPFYYIERGMKERIGGNWKWLGKIFAFFGMCAGVMGIGTITQISGITEAADRVFKSDVLFCVGEKNITLATVICGTGVTLCVALIILGGIKRIAKVSEIVVPFMAVAYVVLALIILIFNITKLPSAIEIIFRSAFDVNAVGGAIAGLTVKAAMKSGIGRGIFSNEAGLGSAPIAAAAAKTKDPVRQGLVTMTGTFIDTVVICTMTGLSIVVTGAWNPQATGADLEGFNITAYAWGNGIPLGGNVSVITLSLCLVFFAFTSILGWDYYSERCLEYLVGSKKRGTLLAFRIIYIAAVAVGPYLTVSAVWTLADIFNALMALPNLVALIALGGVAAAETNKYFDKKPLRLTGLNIRR